MKDLTDQLHGIKLPGGFWTSGPWLLRLAPILLIVGAMLFNRKRFAQIAKLIAVGFAVWFASFALFNSPDFKKMEDQQQPVMQHQFGVPTTTLGKVTKHDV